jgi:hypothetical protein
MPNPYLCAEAERAGYHPRERPSSACQSETSQSTLPPGVGGHSHLPSRVRPLFPDQADGSATASPGRSSRAAGSCSRHLGLPCGGGHGRASEFLWATAWSATGRPWRHLPSPEFALGIHRPGFNQSAISGKFQYAKLSMDLDNSRRTTTILPGSDPGNFRVRQRRLQAIY